MRINHIIYSIINRFLILFKTDLLHSYSKSSARHVNVKLDGQVFDYNRDNKTIVPIDEKRTNKSVLTFLYNICGVVSYLRLKQIGAFFYRKIKKLSWMQVSVIVALVSVRKYVYMYIYIYIYLYTSKYIFMCICRFIHCM
jgi:hypothetical protein